MLKIDPRFRAHMQALARRGGDATKKLADPEYYSRIGRLGGEASVAARKRRIYAELDGGVCEPSAPPQTAAPSEQAQQPPPQTKKFLTLADILGEEQLLSLAFGPASSRSSRR